MPTKRRSRRDEGSSRRIQKKEVPSEEDQRAIIVSSSGHPSLGQPVIKYNANSPNVGSVLGQGLNHATDHTHDINDESHFHYYHYVSPFTDPLRAISLLFGIPLLGDSLVPETFNNLPSELLTNDATQTHHSPLDALTKPTQITQTNQETISFSQLQMEQIVGVLLFVSIVGLLIFAVTAALDPSLISGVGATRRIAGNGNLMNQFDQYGDLAYDWQQSTNEAVDNMQAQTNDHMWMEY